MRRIRSGLLAAIVATCVAGPSPRVLAANAAALRAGAAVVDVTPQTLPVSMTGSFSDRQATAVHDPLKVRCLVIDDGRTRVALLTVDSCLVSRATFDEAKRRASQAAHIPVDHILMSATHTHTAVSVVDLADCRADARYLEFLTKKLAEAVVLAARRLQPARLGWGVASLPGEVFNRRWKLRPGTSTTDPFGRTADRVKTNPGIENPDVDEAAGPTDPDVMVLAATTTDGKPLALYAVYSLHYVGGIPRDSLSADYFGEFAAQVGRRLAPESSEFVALLANGTSGDINNIDTRTQRPPAAPFERVRVVAANAAAAAVEAYRACEFADDVRLQAVAEDLSLGVRKPSADDLAQAQAYLADAVGKPVDVVRSVYAREQQELARWPDTFAVPLQVLRIGGLAIAAIPCEAFVQIGLDVKRRSPRRPTFVVGLANGYHGYLPTPEQHALGGYETWRCRWSYLEVDASTKITDALVRMLDDTEP